MCSILSEEKKTIIAQSAESPRYFDVFLSKTEGREDKGRISRYNSLFEKMRLR